MRKFDSKTRCEIFPNRLAGHAESFGNLFPGCALLSCDFHAITPKMVELDLASSYFTQCVKRIRRKLLGANHTHIVRIA